MQNLLEKQLQWFDHIRVKGTDSTKILRTVKLEFKGNKTCGIAQDMMIQPSIGRYQEEGKELAKKFKRKYCGKKEKIGDFSPTDPYKLKIMPKRRRKRNKCEICSSYTERNVYTTNVFTT
jgi:hypothetical protein